MSSFSLGSLVNASSIDAFGLYARDFFISVTLSVAVLHEKVFSIFTSVTFDDLRWTLLKGFLLLLLLNITSIAIVWWFYGQKICERFMKPATSSTIEELKASVARLKLPEDHTPRI